MAYAKLEYHRYLYDTRYSFFGALVCFVAGVKIALVAGLVSFSFGSFFGWALAHIAYSTGYSNTLITRQYGLGVKGSVLASVIFSFLIIGMLALENALLYRGILFFFDVQDFIGLRILVYGLLTCLWILGGIVTQVEDTFEEIIFFTSQFPDEVLQGMGIFSDWDKFVFSMNILIGPACALPLVAMDYGRYAKSPNHATAAVIIGGFFQSVIVTLIGGILMFAAAEGLLEYFMQVNNLSIDEARKMVLNTPDSIAAAFMVSGGIIGFILMIVAQAKAQVLNCYSASLSLANFSDALIGWRPGRFVFVILTNIIALAMLYGHILEFVEEWISLLGVLLSTLAGVILMDFYITKPFLIRSSDNNSVEEIVNWSGVITIVVSVVSAHYLFNSIIPIEVITSCFVVLCLYPLLRLVVLR